MVQRKVPKNVYVIINSLIVIIICVSLNTDIQLISQNLANDKFVEGPFDYISYAMFRYIREKTPEDSIVIFFKPRAMNLLTERNSFMTKNCEDLLKAEYIVMHKFMGTYDQIKPEKISDCNPNVSLTQIFENEMFLTYSIDRKN